MRFKKCFCLPGDSPSRNSIKMGYRHDGERMGKQSREFTVLQKALRYVGALALVVPRVSYLQLYNPPHKLLSHCFSKVSLAVFSLCYSHAAILILFSFAVLMLLYFCWHGLAPALRVWDLSLPGWSLKRQFAPSLSLCVLLTPKADLLELVCAISHRLCWEPIVHVSM